MTDQQFFTSVGRFCHLLGVGVILGIVLSLFVFFINF